MCSTCSDNTEKISSTNSVPTPCLLSGSQRPHVATSNLGLARGHRVDRRALGEEPSKVEDGTTIDVDMEDDILGSNLDNFRVVEDDEAHASVSSTTQNEARRLQMETTTASEITEVAGFGSDTSPRTESGDYDELGQAEAN